MLGKLLKYEIRATARWFLPIYAAILFFAGINRLLFSDPLTLEGPGLTFKQILTGLSIFVYIILIVSLMVITLVVSIIRFYKSLLGDEGYLMFTLPVKTWKHILNKLLIALMWSLASGLFALLSIFIMVPSPDLAEFRRAFAEFRVIFGSAGTFTIPLMTIVGAAFGILEIYAAIALGHLFNKHKLLISFGMYIGINTICQFVLMLLLPMFVNNMVKIYGEVENITGPVSQTILVTCAITAILAAGCYILTNTLLKKKLNLE